MLRKTLPIFTFLICGFMNLQAHDPISPTQSPEINKEEQLACCRCGKGKKCGNLDAEGILASCSKCKNRRLA